MTQDEIIRMARELVTRHGIRMCDEDGETHGEELYCVCVEDIAEIIKHAAAHEREACANVCDENAKEWADGNNDWCSGQVTGSNDCATAIRARGEK